MKKQNKIKKNPDAFEIIIQEFINNHDPVKFHTYNDITGWNSFYGHIKKYKYNFYSFQFNPLNQWKYEKSTEDQGQELVMNFEQYFKNDDNPTFEFIFNMTNVSRIEKNNIWIFKQHRLIVLAIKN